MMTHFTQAAQQVERRWLSFLVRSLSLAAGIIVILQPASLIAAAECPVNKDNQRIHGNVRWEGITSPIQAFSIAVAQDCFCELTPYMSGSRFISGKTDTPKMTMMTGCQNLHAGKTAILHQTTFSPIGKVISQKQSLKASTLPYNGKRQVLKIRMTPPEITPSAIHTPSTFIGPVQEIQKSILSDEGSMTQARALALPIDKTPSPFEVYPLGPLSLSQNIQRQPDAESHQMRLITSQALHGRDCVSDCL